MGKYGPLSDYLKNIEADISEATLSFENIEGILGARLPASAHKYREWWANPSSAKQHPHAQSWLRSGWKVDTVNQASKWVRFTRS